MMHPSVMKFFHDNVSHVEIAGKDIAEVGSRDNNGTVRELIEHFEPNSYFGIDILPGPKVDYVCDASNLPQCGMFDVVISTECLDHCEDWKSAVTGMITALKPGGIWILTTRSPGFPYHRHPEDYWRFNLADMGVIAERLGLRVITLVPDPYPSHAGVFIKAKKPFDWSADCIDLDDVTVAEVVKD